MTKEEAWSFGRQWIAAWNSHDLDAILDYYDETVELISPTAAEILGVADGRVVGKANLRIYFQRGLRVHSGLLFQLEDVLWGLDSIVLYYVNYKGSRTAEFMEISPAGKVTRVVANYSAEGSKTLEVESR